jgi:hypothetical protein
MQNHVQFEVKIHHWKGVHKISLLKSVWKPCLILSCGQAWQVGHTVAQLVEALCYKLEGHGYPSGIPYGVIGIIHWHSPSGYPMSLRNNSASNRGKYQECFLGDKGGWCVGLTTLTTFMCSLSLIWVPQPPGTLRAHPGLYRDWCMWRVT